MRCALRCKSAQSSSYVTKTEMILVICNSTSGQSFVRDRVESRDCSTQHSSICFTAGRQIPLVQKHKPINLLITSNVLSLMMMRT